MSRYRRLKIEGGAFFYALALADRGGNASELSGRFGDERVGTALCAFAYPTCPARRTASRAAPRFHQRG